MKKKVGVEKVVVFLIVGVFVFSFMAAAVSAEEVECYIESITGTIPGTNPPAQCAGGYIDVKAKLTYAFDIWEWGICSGKWVTVSGFFNLYEKDVTILDDDFIDNSLIISGDTYNCAKKTLTYTFEDLYLGSWASGDPGGNIELYVAGEGSSDAGISECNNRGNDVSVRIIDGDCSSGACCNLNTCYYKSSGSQPTGISDYYYCHGSESPSGDNYIRKKDYECNGRSAEPIIGDIFVETCGTCAYCKAGYSSCFFYYQNEKCGTKDCDYLESSYPCRDYHDIDKVCTGGDTCEATASCSNSYTNRPKHTSCGSGKECNGNGNCITCTTHSYYACSDNDVYYYDACDNREDKEDECGDDYSKWWGLPKCEGGNVVQKKEYHDRGCFNDECYDSVWYGDFEIKYECQNECENGKCINECDSDSACGESGWIYFCGDGSWGITDGNAYKIYETRKCKYPGSAVGASYCYSDYGAHILVEVCNYGCSNGECNPPPCTDECSSGQTRCNGAYKQTCGNYDLDDCLEWPSSTSGPGNEECVCGCQDGQCIVLEGDVDCNGAVDIFDLAVVGLAFGSRPGDTNWNEDADMTGDGKVNIFDLATVGLNYGQSC